MKLLSRVLCVDFAFLRKDFNEGDVSFWGRDDPIFSTVDGVLLQDNSRYCFELYFDGRRLVFKPVDIGKNSNRITFDTSQRSLASTKNDMVSALRRELGDLGFIDELMTICLAYISKEIDADDDGIFPESWLADLGCGDETYAEPCNERRLFIQLEVSDDIPSEWDGENLIIEEDDIADNRLEHLTAVCLVSA